MSREPEQDNDEQSRQLDTEEKKAITTIIRIPILIFLALLLMIGMYFLATQMHGG
jgi:hypothetical protein